MNDSILKKLSEMLEDCTIGLVKDGAKVIGEEAKKWTVDAVIDGMILFTKGVLKFLQLLADQGEVLFIIVAIIGILFTMGGNRKLGTKISSGAIMSFIILKVVG